MPDLSLGCVVNLFCQSLVCSQVVIKFTPARAKFHGLVTCLARDYYQTARSVCNMLIVYRALFGTNKNYCGRFPNSCFHDSILKLDI